MSRFLISLLMLSIIPWSSSIALPSNQLAQDAIIIDTHIDVPFRVFRDPTVDVTQPTDGGQFDLPRAKSGGLNVIFMSIYIPASVDAAGNAKQRADELIDLVHGIAKKAPKQAAMATCVSDIYKQKEAGLISFPMGMENGGPIEGELANVKYFFDRGIRYITLAHSRWNHISDSSYDPDKHWGGLSDFGKSLVAEMNRYGIMVDISHLSDAAAWQVLEISKTPVIASHSSLRHFVPGFERNMTDEMVVALAKNGGVIQINFGSSFISAAASLWSKNRSAAVETYKKEHSASDDEAKAYAKQWAEQHPYPYASINDVLDHIDRVVQLVGIDYVGLGSDFDGVGDTLPTDLKDVASYPNLILGLRARGYTDQAIKKIMGGNVLRVWSEVEKFATTQGQQPLCSS